MTHSFLKMFMLLFILTCIIPKANAQYFSESGDSWDNYYISGTTTFASNSAYWIQGAAAGGKVYTLPATTAESGNSDTAEDGETLTYMIGLDGTYYTRGLYFDFEKDGAEYFSGGGPSGYLVDASGSYCYAGPAIASDGAETLWMATRRSATAPQALQANNAWAKGIKAVAYYTKENLPSQGASTSLLGIDLSSYNIGRSDLMSAYGNGATEEGYLWFCDETNDKVVRVKIVNGEAAGETEFTPPCTVVARSLAVQYSDDRVIYSSGRDGNKKIYRGVINGSSITWYDLGVTTVGNSTSYGSPGAKMFILGGYEYLAYSSATTQFTINVYDGTNPANTTPLSSSKAINPFTLGAGASWMNHSIDAIVADDKMSADLYVYVPNRGCFKKKITALKSIGSIEEIKVDNIAPPIYYNLQGIKVSNPSNGVYIIKQGQKVSKQYVR